MTLVEKADQLAERAHEGQTRKESNKPYISHPRAVADILKEYGFADEVVAAALVHDVVEDTAVSIDEIRRELGEEVAHLVEAVTYDDSLSWEEKRHKYIEAVRQAPEGAKAISIADKIHNARSLIAGHQAVGKMMWKNFNRDRDTKIKFEEATLKMFQDTWQHPLVDEYAGLVEEMKALEY